MSLYTSLGLYISLFLFDSGRYGPENHNGKWLQCYRYDNQGRIDTHMSWIHPIHIMCDNIGLILENIALEIITLGVCTAIATISSEKPLTQMSMYTSFDVI